MIRNHVPFDIAHALVEGGPIGETQALAYCITFNELQGGEYDWDNLSWKKKNG